MTDSGRPFQAMLWKEFREGLKWGVVGLILMIVGLKYSTWGFANEMDEMPGMPMGSTLVWSMLIGLILGLGQTIHESRGDKWGFLAHHPLSRTSLFWAKAGAGAALFLLAVALPIAAAIGLAARAVPFHPRLLEPLIVDLTCGLAVYFAGLFTGMRKARWYASRAMGLGLTLVAAVAAGVLQEFWQAALAVTVSLIVLMTAAWGTFIAGGEYDDQPAASRFAVGLSIAPGLALAGAILLAIVTAFIPGDPPRERGPSVWTEHVVTRNGSILKITRDRPFGRRPPPPDIRDLEGRPVELYRDSAARAGMTEGVVASQPIVLSSHPTFASRHGYRDTRRSFVRLIFSDGVMFGESAPRWYYSHDVRLIELLDAKTGHVGWLGPDGFSEGDVLPARRFTGPFLGGPEEYSRKRSVLVFPDAIYRVNVEDRRVEELFRVPAEEAIIATAQPNGYDRTGDRSDPGRSFYAVLTARHLYVLGPDGRHQLTIARDSTVGDSASVAVIRAYLTPDTATFAWYYPASRGNKAQQHVTEFRASRPTPVARYAIPWDSTSMMHRGYGDRIPASFSMGAGTDISVVGMSGTDGADAPALLATVPPILTLGSAVIRAVRPAREPIAPARASRFPVWVLPLLSGLFSAIAIAGIGSRYSFEPRRQLVWVAIGLLLGPLGVLLMLALLEWPALEPCRSCGKKRVVTRKRCEHCGAPFSPPAADGTEVFELAHPVSEPERA